MSSRIITLCADDYGLAPGIGRGIRALIELNRVHATGCMTGSPHWPDEAALLKPLGLKADLGVHLTLTEQTALAPLPGLAPDRRLPGIGRLIKLSLTGQLDEQEIGAELERQVDAFEAAMGRPPDFLDGHHHVHQLPVIRDAVIDLWRRRLRPTGGWIRCCWESPARILLRGIDPVRAVAISLLGLGFRRKLERSGIRHNRSFRGVYDFSGKIAYGTLFRTFSQAPPPGTLIMCHPGEVDAALEAVEWMTTQRQAELDFLSSAECMAELGSRGLKLGRL